MTKISALLSLLVFTLFLNAQEVINLYPEKIPNSIEIDRADPAFERGMYSKVTKPTLEIFKPENGKSNGTAIVICPGGGYSVVVYEAEGKKTAEEFAKNGITVFLLKYRIPNDSTMKDKKTGPLQDVQQAFRFVRENAVKWGIDPNKVGIMGFSAGGHLASTAATHFEKPVIENAGNVNLRPDFQILIYPVISMQEKLTHADSRKALLGISPTMDVVDLFSNELQVNAKTPPAYITHAADDFVVDVENSVKYFSALKKNKIPAEMHIYPKGNHGFVLRNPTEVWVKPIIDWLKGMNLLNK